MSSFDIVKAVVDKLITDVIKDIKLKYSRFIVGHTYKLDLDIYEIIRISKARTRITYMCNGEEGRRQIRWDYRKNCEYIYPYDIELFKALGRSKYKMERHILTSKNFPGQDN